MNFLLIGDGILKKRCQKALSLSPLNGRFIFAGGVADLVKDGRAGYIVAAGAYEEVAERVLAIKINERFKTFSKPDKGKQF